DGCARLHRHQQGFEGRRRHHHAASAERADERRAAAVGAGVFQELRPDDRAPRAGETGCDRHASGTDEPRRRDRIGSGGRYAGRDPAAGDLRHRGAHGSDEYSGGKLKEMKIHIKNGHLVDPANGVDAKQDLYIAAGKIVGVGSAPAAFTATKTIDASGLVVAPGLVDLSARLREPGYEHKATLESEMQAAVQGGITSLVCPPDTDPVLDEPGLVEMLKHRARLLNQAHVYPLGALTMKLQGEALTEMAE